MIFMIKYDSQILYQYVYQIGTSDGRLGEGGGCGVSDLLFESSFRVNHNWAIGGGGAAGAQVVFGWG